MKVDNYMECCDTFKYLYVIDGSAQTIAKHGTELKDSIFNKDKNSLMFFTHLKTASRIVNKFIIELAEKGFTGLERVEVVNDCNPRQKTLYSSRFVIDCCGALGFAFYALTPGDDEVYHYRAKVRETLRKQCPDKESFGESLMKLSNAWSNKDKFCDVLSKLIEGSKGVNVFSGFRKGERGSKAEIHNSAIFASMVSIEYGEMLNENIYGFKCDGVRQYLTWMVASLWAQIASWMHDLITLEIIQMDTSKPDAFYHRKGITKLAKKLLI